MTVVEANLPSVVEDLSDLKQYYKIDDEPFNQAVKFGMALTSFSSLVQAYASVFPEIQGRSLKRDAASYIKRKYVSEVVKRLQAGNYLMFADTRREVIEEMGKLALDRDQGRQQVEAAKVFLEHTSMPENVTLDVMIDMTDESKEMMNQFLSTIKAVANGSVGMIGAGGVITDVEVIH